MKRFNKTAVALATAGAMTLAIVPNASAEPFNPENPAKDYFDSNNDVPSFEDLENNTNPNAVNQPEDQNAPRDGRVGDNGVSGNAGDKVVVEKGNGTTETSTVPAPAEQHEDAFQPTPVTLNKGDQIVDFAGNVQHTAQADGEFATLEPGDRVIRNGKEVTNEVLGSKDANAPRPVTLKWGDVVVDKDGRIVWSAKANGENAVLQEGDKVVPAGRIGVGILAGLAAVTLGGILYNVVKNAKGEPVLVPEDRADQTPTAEDEAKTEQLVKDNAEEIAAQAAEENGGADARTADRGVGAATGNNTIAKGLVGLLIASIMGAAAFAFGRRRLV